MTTPKQSYQMLTSQVRRQSRNRELIIERAFRRSAYGKQAGEKLASRLQAIRAEILADCTPAIAALREADEVMQGIGSRIRGYVADGYTVQPGAMDKYSRIRREHTGGDDNGMQDNCPLWTTGHALAARDAAKA